MKHAYGRGYDSTWHAYDRRMTTPLLRCAPLATPRGRCHGIKDEYLRRGAEAVPRSRSWPKNPRPLSRVAQQV